MGGYSHDVGRIIGSGKEEVIFYFNSSIARRFILMYIA